MQDQSFQLEYSVLGAPGQNWRVRRGDKPAMELFGLWLSVIAYSWVAILLVGFGAVVAAIVLGSGVLGFTAVVAGIFLIPMLASAAAGVRRRRAAAVVGYLQQAVRLNLPLPRLLAAAAFSEQGVTRRRIIAIKEELEIGRPLSEALASAVPEISMRTLGLIDLADQTGGLIESLNRLVGEDVRASRSQRNDRVLAVWYPALVVTLICLLLTLIEVFVAPKFVQIFHDYHLQLPAVFLLTNLIASWIWIPVPVLVLTLLLGLGAQLRKTVHRPAPVWALRDWRDSIAWYIPVFSTLVQDRNVGDLCTAIADAIRQGFPLDGSLDRLGNLDLNSVFKRRIANWAVAMRRGLPPAEAARHAKMPKLLAGMISTARNTEAMTDVFCFVGRFYTDRFLLRREAIRAAVIPVFTVITGVIVALVALSLFVPMQSLIDVVAR